MMKRRCGQSGPFRSGAGPDADQAFARVYGRVILWPGIDKGIGAGNENQQPQRRGQNCNYGKMFFHRFTP
jgi:hypothetical protein